MSVASQGASERVLVAVELRRAGWVANVETGDIGLFVFEGFLLCSSIVLFKGPLGLIVCGAEEWPNEVCWPDFGTMVIVVHCCTLPVPVMFF